MDIGIGRDVDKDQDVDTDVDVEIGKEINIEISPRTYLPGSSETEIPSLHCRTHPCLEKQNCICQGRSFKSWGEENPGKNTN